MTNNCDMNTKLNNLILQASQTISCDSTCQKEKTQEDLKKKYLDAQMNEASASNQVQTAKKIMLHLLKEPQDIIMFWNQT